MKLISKICIVAIASIAVFGIIFLLVICLYDKNCEQYHTAEFEAAIEKYRLPLTSTGDSTRIDTTLFYVYKSPTVVVSFYRVFELRHRIIAVKQDVHSHISDTTDVVLFYERYEDGDNYMEDGSFYPFSYYVRDKTLYIVTNIGAMSNGWLTEYQLFKIDMETLSSYFILDCAAIAVDDPNGFIAAQGRLINEKEATCVADEIWVMHDVYLDWNGRLNRISSEEYDCGKTMPEKYFNEDYNYPCFNKGFNSSISNKIY